MPDDAVADERITLDELLGGLRVVNTAMAPSAPGSMKGPIISSCPRSWKLRYQAWWAGKCSRARALMSSPDW